MQGEAALRGGIAAVDHLIVNGDPGLAQRSGDGPSQFQHGAKRLALPYPAGNAHVHLPGNRIGLNDGFYLCRYIADQAMEAAFAETVRFGAAGML